MPTEVPYQNRRKQTQCIEPASSDLSAFQVNQVAILLDFFGIRQELWKLEIKVPVFCCLKNLCTLQFNSFIWFLLFPLSFSFDQTLGKTQRVLFTLASHSAFLLENYERYLHQSDKNAATIRQDENHMLISCLIGTCMFGAVFIYGRSTWEARLSLGIQQVVSLGMKYTTNCIHLTLVLAMCVTKRER